MCSPRKYPHQPQGRLTVITRERGISKAKVKGKFSSGVGFELKNLLWEGDGYFLETHKYTAVAIFRAVFNWVLLNQLQSNHSSKETVRQSNEPIKPKQIYMADGKYCKISATWVVIWLLIDTLPIAYSTKKANASYLQHSIENCSSVYHIIGRW